jgi:hypothetical protein
MKKTRRRISLLHQTLELEPNYRPAYCLGWCVQAPGNFAAALREFEKLQPDGR